MFELGKLKKDIQNILSANVGLEQMLLDLKMNNIYIKQKAGNIEIFKVVNKNLIEKVWKSMSIKKIVDRVRPDLLSMGIKKNTVDQQINKLLLETSLSRGHESTYPIEGIAKEGFVEIEVFKIKEKTKN